jgi:hypothetical protein
VPLVVIVLLLSNLGLAFADFNTNSFDWNLEKPSNLCFNPAMNFTSSPFKCIPYDDSLVGYWNMDEGSGLAALDSSNNNNNGTIHGAKWVAGKFGSGIAFDGSIADYVKVNNSLSLQVTGNLTLSCWVFFNSLASKQTLIFKSYSGEYELSMAGNSGSLEFDNTGTIAYSPSSAVRTNVWLHIVVVRSMLTRDIVFYVNGVEIGTPRPLTKLPISSSNTVYIGQENGYNPLNGIIDDVRIYDCALSANAVLALYQQENPLSYENYNYYTDSATNNTMLLSTTTPDGSDNNTTSITCSQFFTNNRLAFLANSSTSVNIWTNLGLPALIRNGTWNSQNYTVTLNLDPFIESECIWAVYNITTYIDMHSNISPSNVSIGYSGTQLFTIDASDGYRSYVAIDGIPMGQMSTLLLNNLTAPHVVNVTSVILEFNITASTDIGADIFPSNTVLINYEGSMVFTIKSKSGYEIAHVYVDNIDKGVIDNYTFANVTDNHLISVTSEPLPNISPSPSPSSVPVPSPSSPESPSLSPNPSDPPTPKTISNTKTNQVPTQAIILLLFVITAIVVGFGLMLRKGYIMVDVVNEKTDEADVRDDNEEETEGCPDYSI